MSTERVRPTRDEVFIEMVEVLAQRSVCKRKQVGAMITIDGRPISVGYNGPPSGSPHCEECSGTSCDISIHAEMNAIVFAAKEGIRIKGGTLYCTMSPCINCAKAIVNSGIKRVVYKEKYRLSEGEELLLDNRLVVGSIGEMYFRREATFYNGQTEEWYKKAILEREDGTRKKSENEYSY